MHHCLKLIYSTQFIDSNGLFQGMMRPQQLARTLRKVLEWHICWGKGWMEMFSVVLEQSHWNFAVCHQALEAAPSPGVCHSHRDRRCSSSAECQAAFALARETEIHIGSLGRSRELCGHHPNTLWNGTAGQNAAVSPTPHFTCVHQHHNPAEIPL